jgi:hypothetical protein
MTTYKVNKNVFKWFSLLLMVSLILTISCKTRQKSAATQKSDEPVFVLQKTACFGECPVYTLKIFSDGLVTLKGEHFVDKIGNYTNQIPADEVQQLISDFQSANFFDFQDEYTSEATDLPTTYVTFNHDGRSKKITDYYGAPDELKLLENTLERYIIISNWKKVEEKK